jgi:hypothetical protein
MKSLSLLLVCVGVLAFVPAAQAGAIEVPAPLVPDGAVSTTDPFLAMSEITTHVTSVEPCPSGLIDPRCEHGPIGEDCSTFELYMCHCNANRHCVKNP